MPWYQLAYGLMGVCAIIIIVVYARKLPLAASLDLSAMKEYRERSKKAALLENRLRRKLSTVRQFLKDILSPLGRGIFKIFRRAFYGLRSLEDRYRQAAVQSQILDAGSQQQSLSAILEQARAFIAEEKFAEAEKMYIAAIALDKTSLEAYRGLARMYVELGNLDYALETYVFLEQLDPNDETMWQERGELLKTMERPADALKAYEQALILGPNNPKNLDAAIALYIVNKLKYKAQSALDKLKEVNPENNSIAEYQTEIEAL